jgi:hypothetical protein
MLKYLLYTILLASLISSCRRDNDPGSTILEGRWKMVAVKENATQQIYLPPNGQAAKTWLKFESLKFTGHTGSNAIFNGSFKLTNSTDVVFGIFNMTDVTEQDWGRYMLQMLGSCLIQSVMPCKPCKITRPSENLLVIDLPGMHYTITFERF